MAAFLRRTDVHLVRKVANEGARCDTQCPNKNSIRSFILLTTCFTGRKKSDGGALELALQGMTT